MKKYYFLGLLSIAVLFSMSFCSTGNSSPVGQGGTANNTNTGISNTKTKSTMAKTIYDFKIASIDGGTIDFSKYKGKYILIVNTASKCGFTPQYKGLEKLYKDYGDKLVIVGFPSDNFHDQEFHDNKDIQAFCEKNYGVTFPLTTRVDVKGSDITPVFDYLTHKSENGQLDAVISWNFNKFLIDPQGKLLAHFDSKITPESPEITHYFK
ncbi:glutathione peroxidase [Arachidicoccus ginsenosidivorans]|uniref:Glutathione peroxidase n=1 Tax=Arachidicoccus ginsenosidivorans TaxID=496057 RepID=A0A5B8VNS2_9BACT|nr:glutathione peroxidase [Arachidicoccus ginsenosidivorans]QEC73059.1 glutathione peroxidase [Arachidicoccus ginsenosidivorans]